MSEASEVLQHTPVEEKIIKGYNGYAALFLMLFILLSSIAMIVLGCIWPNVLGIVGIVLGCILLTAASISLAGLKVVAPKEAIVLVLFGKYYGTINKDGFYFVNPFCTTFNPATSSVPATINPATASVTIGTTRDRKIPLKAMTLNNEKQTVNDEIGNPVIIGTIVIWRVVNTAKAVFNVNNYKTFLSIQCDSATRNITRLYPYDVSDGSDEKTLRGSSQEIADMMKQDLQERVAIAGLEILEVRITHLSYAPEIAAAMLQRQQAEAIIAARQKIVEGAVGMVEMALQHLNENDVVELDEERKAAMVSNLLVVLCGNKDAQPIVNSGSIY